MSEHFSIFEKETYFASFSPQAARFDNFGRQIRILGIDTRPWEHLQRPGNRKLTWNMISCFCLRCFLLIRSWGYLDVHSNMRASAELCKEEPRQTIRAHELAC